MIVIKTMPNIFLGRRLNFVFLLIMSKEGVEMEEIVNIIFNSALINPSKILVSDYLGQQ